MVFGRTRMSGVPHDPRRTAARPDLAAASLQGRVEAARFVAGRNFGVTAPAAAVRRRPASDAPLDTQALCGERVTVYDEEEGWAWAQLDEDGYVGYIPAEALSAAPSGEPTHRVVSLRSFLFPGPDIKLPPLHALPLGAKVAVIETRGDFLRTEAGYLWARHLGPVEVVAADFVATAERFLGVPYLWGGKTALGLDCSGLVQLSLAAAGRAAPRDSGMQEQELGIALGASETLRRGDLVFWRGHVGIMRDPETLLHANGYAMAVTSEPLTEAVTRTEAAGAGPVTSVRRL